ARRNARRCNATLMSTKSAPPRSSSPPIWPAASPARPFTLTAVTTSWVFESHFDLTLVLTGRHDRDLHVALARQPWELLSPLDQQDIARIRQQFVEPKRCELALGINAIQIDVVQRCIRAAVFVD